MENELFILIAAFLRLLASCVQYAGTARQDKLNRKRMKSSRKKKR